MRGMQWSPSGGFRCGDCGGYEVDLRADGSARCRTCGRVSVPGNLRRFAGIGRLAFTLVGIFLAVLVVEGLVSFAYAGGDRALFLRTVSILFFITGLAAVMVAGVGAAPGRVAMGTQRMDRLGRLYPVQDPQMVGTYTSGAEVRTVEEPGLTGVLVLAGFGIALIIVGYVFGVA